MYFCENIYQITMKTFYCIFFLLFFALAFKSDKPAYQLFDKDGNQVLYSEMMNRLKDADIVLFGELHNNAIAHWLELEITKDLYEIKKDKLILGAEMFEADNQTGVDRFLIDSLSDKKLKMEVRLWPNYETDYKPLLKFAKENKLKFIATNIPRKYASSVMKGGFESLQTLPDSIKAWIAPLPIKYDAKLKCYTDMMNMSGMTEGFKPTENFPKAQAMKDATMAHFILKSWSKEKLFMHYNGSFHSDNFLGITWYLKQQNPDLKIVTIATGEKSDISTLGEKNIGLADFIICVDEDVTKTY